MDNWSGYLFVKCEMFPNGLSISRFRFELKSENDFWNDGNVWMRGSSHAALAAPVLAAPVLAAPVPAASVPAAPALAGAGSALFLFVVKYWFGDNPAHCDLINLIRLWRLNEIDTIAIYIMQ